MQTYSDPLDIEHLDTLRDHMNHEILSGAAGKVHIIADMRQVRNLPGMMLTRGAFMFNNLHPNTGMVVAVIGNELVYRMARVFSGLVPRRAFRVVHSFDEAEAIIDEALARE